MRLTDEQRQLVVTEALSWLKTPWHHRGRIKGKGGGVDCGMFPLEVYERVKLIPHIETPQYPFDWHLHQSEEKFLAIVESFCDRTDEALPGDIVTYRYGRCVSHGAIVVKWPTVIHAVIRQGVLCDDASRSQELVPRQHGIYTFRA